MCRGSRGAMLPPLSLSRARHADSARGKAASNPTGRGHTASGDDVPCRRRRARACMRPTHGGCLLTAGGCVCMCACKYQVGF